MKKKSIHFIGIKGVGVAPLAIIAKEAGFEVSGCDIAEEFITDNELQRAGITPLVGFDPSHLEGVDMIITTGAHGGYDNPEVKAGKEKGLPVLTQGEAVGKFQSGEFFGKTFTGISVAGSHGKTTTTALIATVFSEAGKNPSYVAGTSELIPLGASGHFGKGNYFIAEADEYATEPVYDKTPKFLWQHPHIAVITNIELDHPDLYPTLDDITLAFRKFALGVPQDGVVIICGDDPQIKKAVEGIPARVVTYGFSKGCDFQITRFSPSTKNSFFWVEGNGTSLGELSIKVPGEHNALNATAALVVALEAGLPLEVIKKGLTVFAGTKRRLEYKGTLPSEAMVFDDYAHHPTEIRKTLKALKDRYPKSRIVCIFQPHTYSRTKALFSEFSHAFFDASEVILTDIYASLREEKDPSVSSEQLVNAIRAGGKRATYIPTLTEVSNYLNSNPFDRHTVIITMGAGDIYKVWDALSLDGATV